MLTNSDRRLDALEILISMVCRRLAVADPAAG